MRRKLSKHKSACTARTINGPMLWRLNTNNVKLYVIQTNQSPNWLRLHTLIWMNWYWWWWAAARRRQRRRRRMREKIGQNKQNTRYRAMPPALTIYIHNSHALDTVARILLLVLCVPFVCVYCVWFVFTHLKSISTYFSFRFFFIVNFVDDYDCYDFDYGFIVSRWRNYIYLFTCRFLLIWRARWLARDRLRIIFLSNVLFWISMKTYFICKFTISQATRCTHTVAKPFKWFTFLVKLHKSVHLLFWIPTNEAHTNNNRKTLNWSFFVFLLFLLAAVFLVFI